MSSYDFIRSERKLCYHTKYFLFFASKPECKPIEGQLKINFIVKVIVTGALVCSEEK